MQVRTIRNILMVYVYPLFLIITISTYITVHSMKTILDWKYDNNGDPMVDVGYFLMMFLMPMGT